MPKQSKKKPPAEPTKSTSLLDKWITNNGQPVTIPLKQMTVRGIYRTVTEEGKATIRASIMEKGRGNFMAGLLRTEPFLVQELPADEKIHKKSKASEYRILGGNHRYEIFLEQGLTDWPCYVLAPEVDGIKMTAAETEMLAGMDNAKHQYGSAKAAWFEDFTKLVRYLSFEGVRKKERARMVIDWNKVHELSGFQDGLSEETAKKLVTAYNKMLGDKENLEANPLYLHMTKLHQQYGFKNPIKLKMFTEVKEFWTLPVNLQVNTIQMFINSINAKEIKGTTADWQMAVRLLKSRLEMAHMLALDAEGADLLEDYQEAVADGKIPWFEKSGEIVSENYSHLLEQLRSGTAVARLKGPDAKLPKSPTAKKPQVEKKKKQGEEQLLREHIAAHLQNIDAAPRHDVPFEEGEEDVAEEAAPLKEPQAGKKPGKKAKKAAAKDTGTTPEKDAKKATSPESVRKNNKPKDGAKEGQNEKEVAPWKENLHSAIESHFDAHFTELESFLGLETPQKSDITFFNCTGPIPNSTWNVLMKNTLENGRVVICAEPQHALHIFTTLARREVTLQFDFKYTAVMSAPPARLFSKDAEPKGPSPTYWDFYFLSFKQGTPHFNNDQQLSTASRNPLWTHGKFKTPTLEEMLRAKASTASALVYPRQPPSQVFEFILAVYGPKKPYVLDLEFASGVVYIASVEIGATYMGYAVTDNKSSLSTHVAKVITAGVETVERADELLLSLTESALQDVQEAQEEPGTPPKAFLAEEDEPLGSPGVPITPHVPGVLPDETPKSGKKRPRSEPPTSPTSHPHKKPKQN